MKELLTKLGWRFLRGFIAGSIGVMVTITPFAGSSFNDLSDWLSLIAIAIAGGGISGGILSIGKFLREQGIRNLPF